MTSYNDYIIEQEQALEVLDDCLTWMNNRFNQGHILYALQNNAEPLKLYFKEINDEKWVENIHVRNAERQAKEVFMAEKNSRTHKEQEEIEEIRNKK